MAHQAAPQSRRPAGETFGYLAMLSNTAGMGIRVCLLPGNLNLAHTFSAVQGTLWRHTDRANWLRAGPYTAVLSGHERRARLDPT